MEIVEAKCGEVIACRYSSPVFSTTSLVKRAREARHERKRPRLFADSAGVGRCGDGEGTRPFWLLVADEASGTVVAKSGITRR